MFGWLVTALLVAGGIDRNALTGIVLGFVTLVIGAAYSPNFSEIFLNRQAYFQEIQLWECLIFVAIGLFLTLPIIEHHNDIIHIEVQDFDKYQEPYYENNPIGLQFDTPLHVKVNSQHSKIIILSQLTAHTKTNKTPFRLEEKKDEIPIHDRTIRIWNLSCVEKDANFPFQKKHANGYFSLSGDIYFTPTTVVPEYFTKSGFDEAVVDYASHILFANPDLKKDLSSALDAAFDKNFESESKLINEAIRFISRFHTEKTGSNENSGSPTIASYAYNDLLQARTTAKKLQNDISKHQENIQDISNAFPTLRATLEGKWEVILTNKFKDHCTQADENQLSQVLVFLKLLGLKIEIKDMSFEGDAKDLLDQLKRCSSDMGNRINEKEKQYTKEQEDRIRFQEDVIKEALNHPDAQNLLPHFLARLNELRPLNVLPDSSLETKYNTDATLDDDLLK